MYDPNQKDSIMRKEVISLTLNQHYFYDFQYKINKTLEGIFFRQNFNFKIINFYKFKN